MYQLTPDPQIAIQYGDRLVNALSNDDLQLRRAVLADLGAIGYLPAADAISQTLAENSPQADCAERITRKATDALFTASFIQRGD